MPNVIFSKLLVSALLSLWPMMHPGGIGTSLTYICIFQKCTFWNGNHHVRDIIIIKSSEISNLFVILTSTIMPTGRALIHLFASICRYVSKLKLALDHSQVKHCTKSENVYKIFGDISWSQSVIYKWTKVSKTVYSSLCICCVNV